MLNQSCLYRKPLWGRVLDAIDHVREGRVIVVEINGHLRAIQEQPCNKGHLSCKMIYKYNIQLSGGYRILSELFSPCAISASTIFWASGLAREVDWNPLWLLVRGETEVVFWTHTGYQSHYRQGICEGIIPGRDHRLWPLASDGVYIWSKMRYEPPLSVTSIKRLVTPEDLNSLTAASTSAGNWLIASSLPPNVPTNI